jgi:small subunit ribosomal protein S8
MILCFNIQMLGFVNDSHKDLIAAIKLVVIGRKPQGSAVYSGFNLKILLFLAARGFISSIKVKNRGPGGVITFKLKAAQNGVSAVNEIWTPYLAAGRFGNRLVKYRGYKELAAAYSSEFVLVSTSKGLMTSLEAIALKVGGLVVCVIK